MADNPVQIGRRWVWPDGTSVPVVSGGSIDLPDPPQDPPPDPPVDPPPPAELGDAGKKALDDERAARKAAEKAHKEALAELEELRTAQLPDNEKLIKEAADAARAEALSEVNSRLFVAELKALTTGKLADPDLLSDPEVAVRLLGFDEIPVTNTGGIDVEAISTAVASLIEAKPYLAGAKPGTPDLGQGARGAPPVKTLDEQIVEAEKAQEWDKAQRLKLQKLAVLAQQ